MLFIKQRGSIGTVSNTNYHEHVITLLSKYLNFNNMGHRLSFSFCVNGSGGGEEQNRLW